jgi:hypothetical protein
MRTDPHRNRKDDSIKTYRHKRLKVLECPEQEADPTAPRAKAMIRSTTRTTPKVDGRIRKRSKNDGLKHTKHLLTDEQRRQNHSTSEKRRRMPINDYLDDLYALVLRLGRRRFGKSAVLELAGCRRGRRCDRTPLPQRPTDPRLRFQVDQTASGVANGSPLPLRCCRRPQRILPLPLQIPTDHR